MTDNKLPTSIEKTAVVLRSIYKQHGYLPFKMSKFEEYDLYVRNKEFLVSNHVITFNDTDGRLLALKPDVTLSIIKNGTYEPGCKQKVYYSENVYRVSHKTHRFKEFMQSGLECIGDTDISDIYEAVSLAAKSLAVFSQDYVLDISHLGILSKVLGAASSDPSFKEQATRLIAEKNRHEIEVLCKKFSVSAEYTSTINELVGTYGDAKEVLPRLAPICERAGAMDAYGELKILCKLLSESEAKENIKLDFSVVNDMNYYNGIVFKGFLKGIPEGVLSGGEYGRLMERMGKCAGAVGFAIYLDLLEELLVSTREYDVDVLIVYSSKTDVSKMLSLKERLVAEGKIVSAHRAVPKKLRYKEIIKLDD